MMDKLIATVDCAFQWFQLLIIARDDVSPVTFAILMAHLIHAEWVSNVLSFSKKVRFCEIFCVLICVDSRIMKVLLSLVGNPTFAPTTRLDFNVFFVLF